MDIKGIRIDKIKHKIIHARIIIIFNDYPSCIILSININNPIGLI